MHGPVQPGVKPSNIKQVAAAAGVSVATVSRALKTPDLVAEETRKRVSDAVGKLSYTPNAQARNLRTARTQLIVALVPDICNSFFAGVIRGIEQVARQEGYSVLLGDTQYELAAEQRYGDMISGREADGLITMLPHLPRIAPRNGGRVPVVNACEYVQDVDVTSIYIDNVKAAQDASSYLLAMGHRQIAHIGGRPDSPISMDRRRGYEQALRMADVEPDPRLMVWGDFSIEAGLRATEAFLDGEAPFTAIFCASDELAIGALSSIRARGLSAPHDISLIGFDDITFARYMDPPLTTVAQPQAELGREAMLLLLDILENPQTRPRKRLLKTQLVIRGTTGPPKR